MIADFHDTFDEVPDSGSDIPREILDILSEDLPAHVCYYKNKEGQYVVGPRPEYISEGMTLKFDIEKSFAEENLRDIPRDKWSEYIYRMQLRIPIRNIKIGDKKEQIPLENTIGNPLKDNSIEIQDAYMYPAPFPPAKTLIFETEEGDVLPIKISRKPYNRFDAMLFASTDFPALQIQFVLSDKRENSKVTYTIMPTKANTVSEVLAAIHLFNGLYKGTVSINGEKLTMPIAVNESFDEKQLADVTEFWLEAKKLEEKLGIEFNPKEKFSIEDAKFFSNLVDCFLKDKLVMWEHPFDRFHVREIDVTDNHFNDFLKKSGGEYAFLEGPMQVTLLGAKFELYSRTQLPNIVVTNVVWDTNEKTSAEIYISDPIGEKWKMYRKYMTISQIEELKKA